MLIIGNSFSIQMLENASSITDVRFEKIDLDHAKRIIARLAKIDEMPVSCVGHIDTAAVISNLLGQEVKMNRISIKLTGQDYLLVAQVVGGRLLEGAVELPTGVGIEWFLVRIIAG